jgi:hypothetical protein
MHRLMLFLLAAAVFTPASPRSGPPPSPPPVLVVPGARAPQPPSVPPPGIPDRLVEIADALRLLTVDGGAVTGPLGRNCPEARERMRWSNLPCSPDHLPPLPLVPVEDPY